MRVVFLALLLPLGLAAQAPALTLAGEFRRAGTLDTTALARFGVDTMSRDSRGTVTTYRGITLWRLLTEQGIATDSAVKNDALRKVVVATARDGYRIVFSVGELDPALGAARALIAWERDGKPFDPERGPFQLLINDARRPARNIYQLERLEIVTP
jgi:hypothetical protein